MSKKLQISIPKPCHENWDGMTPVEKGKFCASCSKQVIDFSRMSDRQLAEFFKRPSTGSVCGRFLADQLDRSIDIPRKRIPWLKYFFQFALPAIFISKAAGQQPKMGKYVASGRDTTKIRTTDELRTMGIVAHDIQPFMGDSTVIEVKTVTRVLRGIVTDENNKPISYASVQEGRTTNLVFCDEKGEFAIKIAVDSLATMPSLVISSAGYETKEVIPDRRDDYLKIRLSGGLAQVDQVSCSQRFILGEISIVDTTQGRKNDSQYTTDQVIQRDIAVPREQPNFSLYPNPVLAGTTVSVGVQLMEEGYYSCQFLTSTGQQVKEMEIWIDADARLLNIDVPRVSAGQYLFVLTNKKTGKKFSGKISIQ